MSIFSTKKKGYLRKLTKNGYITLFPKTEADCVTYINSDAVETNVQTELDEINNNLSEINNNKITNTHLTSTQNGVIRFPNVRMQIVRGSYPMRSLVSDSNIGGYKTNINLSGYGFTSDSAITGYVSALYPSGIPHVVIVSLTNSQLVIGSDANVSGAWINWMVVGSY